MDYISKGVANIIALQKYTKKQVRILQLEEAQTGTTLEQKKDTILKKPT
jgi:hypothetical protein